MIAWPGFLCHQVLCYLHKHAGTNREFPILWEMFYQQLVRTEPPNKRLVHFMNYSIYLVSVNVDVKSKSPHSHYSDRNIPGMHWTDISAGSNGNSSNSTNTCLNTHCCWQHNHVWNFWLNQELLTALSHSFTRTCSHATTAPLTSPALQGRWVMFHTYIYYKYRIQRPEKMHFTQAFQTFPRAYIYTLISRNPDFVVFLYKFSLSNIFTVKSWKSGFWTHVYML